jgi:hypothetical protein
VTMWFLQYSRYGKDVVLANYIYARPLWAKRVTLDVFLQSSPSY